MRIRLFAKRETKTEKNSSYLVDYIVLAVFLMMFLRILPPQAMREFWGFNQFQFPLLISAGAFAFLMFLAVPSVHRAFAGLVSKNGVLQSLSRNYPKLIFLALILLFFLLFYNFWTFSVTQTGVVETNLRSGEIMGAGPLSAFINLKIFNLLDGGEFLTSASEKFTKVAPGWTTQPESLVLCIVANVVGVAFLFFITYLAFKIFPNMRERLIFVLLVGTQGFMFLFFGDRDLHPYQAAALAFFFLCGYLYLEGRIGMFLPSFAFATAFLMHMSSIWLLPALIALVFLKDRRDEIAQLSGHPVLKSLETLRSAKAVTLSLGLLTPALLSWLLLKSEKLYGLSDLMGGGDMSMFVPITRTTTDYEQYTLFSLGNIIDKFNVLLFLAPLTPILIVLLLYYFRRQVFNDDFAVFLLVAAASGLLFLFLWNADFGAYPDWDLFSQAAIATSLFSFYVFTKYFDRSYLGYAATLMLVFSFLHLAPIIWNSH